MCLIELME